VICPICQKETAARYRPFCSKRCADIDLGRWLKGGYVIPADSVEEPSEGSSDTPPELKHRPPAGRAH
jgi:hypothetical protein